MVQSMSIQFKVNRTMKILIIPLEGQIRKVFENLMGRQIWVHTKGVQL
jgi:hypothetical protein